MRFLSIHEQPARTTAVGLSWFLFAVGIASYFYVAQVRHRENPDERVMPTATQMVQAFADATLKPAQDELVEDGAPAPPLWRQITSSMLWKDSLAPSRRFLMSVLLLFPAVV